jgi:hypothetical protein
MSIPYHGNALNITVESYAGSLDFGLIACRRALPQEDLKSLAKHLVKAFEELKAMEPEAEAAEKPEVAAKPRKKEGEARTAK